MWSFGDMWSLPPVFLEFSLLLTAGDLHAMNVPRLPQQDRLWLERTVGACDVSHDTGRETARVVHGVCAVGSFIELLVSIEDPGRYVSRPIATGRMPVLGSTGTP